MRLKKRTRRSVRIEIIPLIDIMFLLLVFFIYAMLSMSVHRGIAVELPFARISHIEKNPYHNISIARSGSLFLDKNPVSLQELPAMLARLKQKEPSVEIRISGDRNSAYEMIVLVMDAVVQKKPSPRQKTTPHKKTAQGLPVKKKIASTNPAPGVKKVAKPETTARRSREIPKKKPVPEQKVSDKPERSTPDVSHANSAERKTSDVRSAPQAFGTKHAKQHTAQKEAGNVKKAGELRQTAGLPQSRGHNTTARPRTLAIPQYDLNMPPVYPRVARMRGQEGTSLLRVKVLPDGTVGEIVLAKSSGHDVLDRAALRSVRSWRFIPGTQEGKPEAMWVQVPITFRLK